MSIQQLPSGIWRAQVYDKASGRNISVGAVLGGRSTFKKRRDAEQARARAREILGGPPGTVARRLADYGEDLRRVHDERIVKARAKREEISKKVATWLASGYDVDPATGCWLWTGSVNQHGYAVVRRSGRAGGREHAHRWFFERVVGPVPPGMCLDHLCGVKRCVNPDHLDPVTPAENTRRALEGIFAIRPDRR